MRALIVAALQLKARTGFAWRSLVGRLRLGHMGQDARLYPRAVINAPRQVRIGARTVINDFVHIWGAGGVTIGEDVLIAAGTIITSQSHEVDALARGLKYNETTDNAPVVIGDNVWLGSGAMILPGVEIGAGSIVAAGAVVTRSVPPATLVAGVPARAIRDLSPA